VSNISRTGSRRLRVALVGGATLAISLGLAAPQNNTRVPTADTTLPSDNLDRGRFGGEEEPYVAREMLAKQMKRLREEHQKQVFSDTERLVQLATALKSEVDKGDKPASDVMKEVDEIGKLAKRVSDRIKTQ
jgi:hypothetical protein